MKMTVQMLLHTLNKLPDTAVLTLDEEYSKLDVHNRQGRWLGGIYLRGEFAGEFYSAVSVEKVLAEAKRRDHLRLKQSN